MAEALGRFGQGGLTSAFYWHGPPEGSPGFYAFRAYRNFDGKGGAFLNFSVPTVVAEGMSLFASRDDRTSKVVLVALNLDPVTAADMEIDVSSCGSAASRRTFTYSGGKSGFVEQATQGEGGTLYQRVAPYSIAVMDVALAAPVIP